MRWRDVGGVTCSVARALSVVGDRWTLLILRDCFQGIRRFEDFQRRTRMSRHRLADRLAKLVREDVLKKVRYQERPARWEYKLTAKGRDLYPVIVSLVGWGDRWMAGDDGPPIELIHRDCGQVVAPTLACPHCNTRVTAHDMTSRLGPALAPKEETTP
jgi:DNA-binding HxlR family transcriptional regulator